MAEEGRSEGPKGANVAIYHLPEDWTPLKVQEMFQQFGTVVGVTAHVDKVTMKSKGYGACSFANPTLATQAIRQMDGLKTSHRKTLKVAIKESEQQFNAEAMAV